MGRNHGKRRVATQVIGNTTAVCDLEFNITASPGVFLGHWRGKPVSTGPLPLRLLPNYVYLKSCVMR